MKKMPDSSFRSSQSGVVIIESLIAILIFSMGILAIVGLQAAMVKSAGESKVRADAAYVAQQRIGRIWADQGNAAAYLGTEDISGQLPGGQIDIQQPVAGQFVITVTWQSPGEAQHTFSTTASILGG